MSANLPKLPKPPKRLHTLAFRLTDDELGKLEAAASKLIHKRSASDLARAVVCKWSHAEIPAPCRPRRHPMRRSPSADVKALAALTAQIGKLGSNVNQLARRANQSGALPQVGLLELLRAEVAGIKQAVEAAIRGGGE